MNRSNSKGQKNLHTRSKRKKATISIDRLKPVYVSATNQTSVPDNVSYPQKDTVTDRKPIHQTRYGRAIFRPRKI